jgi:hypothetical protein
MTQPPYPPPDPSEPMYPYGAQPGEPLPGPPALAAPSRTRLFARPEPRFGVALAAAGVVLVAIGVALVSHLGGSVDEFGGGGGGGGHRALGIVLALVAIVAGYTALVLRPTGPLGAAGVAASALGIPLLLVFATSSSSHPGGQVDVVLLVSLLAWLVSYAVVPGARGHAFYLGVAAVEFWVYLVDKVEPHLLEGALLAPFFGSFDSADDLDGLGATVRPDYASVATLSLVVGVIYLAAAFGLDRAGRAGTSVALVVASYPTMLVGLICAAVELPQSAEGVLLIVLGLVIAALAARSGHRATTWAWAGVVALGVVVIVADAVEDSAGGAGVVLIVVGLLLVAAAWGASVLLRERPETEPAAR